VKLSLSQQYEILNILWQLEVELDIPQHREMQRLHYRLALIESHLRHDRPAECLANVHARIQQAAELDLELGRPQWACLSVLDAGADKENGEAA